MWKEGEPGKEAKRECINTVFTTTIDLLHRYSAVP